MGAVRPAGSRAGRRALTLHGRWRVERRNGTPAVLHRLSAGAPREGRLVRVCRPLSAALVLGSAQRESDADLDNCREARVPVVRRRSGGGAVLVAPGAQLWVDVFVPRGDELFVQDVSASFLWLGEAWAEAIDGVAPPTGPGGASGEVDGIGRACVHRGAPVVSELSARLCFLGAVPGEVFVAGRKVVGCSQRRDRDGAWFHTMALLEQEPARLTALMSFPPAEREEATRLLDAAEGIVRGGRGVVGPLEAALLEALAHR